MERGCHVAEFVRIPRRQPRSRTTPRNSHLTNSATECVGCACDLLSCRGNTEGISDRRAQADRPKLRSIRLRQASLGEEDEM